ncbi:MAG: MoxR family ATPase [Magnetococcales bacterium]|nr:MoxR family ATPase [Magnetococcales bacterium]
MNFLTIDPGHTLSLAVPPGQPELVHVFEKDAIDAVNAALAAGRPLLLGGEPGIGKTQLARAVAKELGRAFIQHVVDAQGESRDLLWYFDAVARLAEAQWRGAVGQDPETLRQALAVDNFLRPGPLWWAFDWNDALAQVIRVHMAPPHQRDGGCHEQGCVVLVDEIDKAETDLPNGLLEALGAGEFTPFGRTRPVTAGDPGPLVIITTNQERTLPDAFVRRCLVLNLRFPDGPQTRPDGTPDSDQDAPKELTPEEFLRARGKSHFPDADPAVIGEAARSLLEDRLEARQQQRQPLPGQAEFLDLLRAVLRLFPNDVALQQEKLAEISRFTLKKHLGAG